MFESILQWFGDLFFSEETTIPDEEAPVEPITPTVFNGERSGGLWVSFWDDE